MKKKVALVAAGALVAAIAGFVILLPNTPDYSLVAYPQLVEECSELCRIDRDGGHGKAMESVKKCTEIMKLRPLIVDVDHEDSTVVIKCRGRSGLRCRLDPSTNDWVVSRAGDHPDREMFRGKQK